MFSKQIVKPAHTAETCGHRHVGDRELRVGEQAPGQEQPLGLKILHGRDAVFGQKDAAQVPVRDIQEGCQFRNLMGSLGITFHYQCSALCQPGNRIHRRQARRQFRAAFEGTACSRQLPRLPH